MVIAARPLLDSLTVTADPSSIEKPRDGECSVMRLPMTRMMLLREAGKSSRQPSSVGAFSLFQTH